MEENKGHQKDLERNVFGLSMILAKQLKENQKFTDPDYWTRLEHQYAGMAMQGMIRTVGHDRMYPPEKIAIYAEACAHALVQKLKEKEERK